MVRFYPRPSRRESLVMFGDGDVATLLSVGNSSIPGRTFFKFRPTPQMRWKKQILDDQYNPNDKWIDRTYPTDLCFPLSLDPDFYQWIILCDYFGNEDSPLFNYFVKVKQLISRNRSLEQEVFTKRVEINKYHLRERLKVMHPEEHEREKLNFLDNVKKVMRDPIYMPQQSPEMESDG